MFQALKRVRGLGAPERYRIIADEQDRFKPSSGYAAFSKHSYYNFLLKTVSTACDLFAITAEKLSL